jgi:hypothetical protein
MTRTPLNPPKPGLCSRVNAAMVFSLTRQPSARSAAVIRGEFWHGTRL